MLLQRFQTGIFKMRHIILPSSPLQHVIESKAAYIKKSGYNIRLTNHTKIC
ncbi:HIT family protein [Neisseria wadsworthii 9715]|uniref:HIT family protein n=1 Tax=Neisseria wadsworthii 9715 TaxID=1030841 RepID=G4CRC9_9NEIS|nr:HIT family protein [Neisseria wadsworthii 9715]